MAESKKYLICQKSYSRLNILACMVTELGQLARFYFFTPSQDIPKPVSLRPFGKPLPICAIEAHSRQSLWRPLACKSFPPWIVIFSA